MNFLAAIADLFLLLILTLAQPLFILHRLMFKRGQFGDHSNLPVVITGRGSGFGRLAAIRLAKEGVPTFAGCRRYESVAELAAEKLENLYPFRMDISDKESVDKAVDYVAEKTSDKGIWALINNAGVAPNLGRAEWLPLENHRKAYDVNVLGTIRATKAILGMIKQNKGRVVTCLSVMAWCEFADWSSYASSKFGINGFMQCLRHEIAQYGVKVITISPGSFSTHITESLDQSFENAFKLAPFEIQERYADNYLERKKRVYKDMYNKFMLAGNSIDEVIDLYKAAVLDKHPKDTYWAGWECYIFNLLSMLPTSVGHRHNVIFQKCLPHSDPDYDHVPIFY